MGRKVKSYQKHVEEMSTTHNNFYTYPQNQQLNLINPSTTVIEITCNIHGVFHQSINGHKNGQKCPSCAKEGRKYRAKVTEDQIIKIFYTHYRKSEYELRMFGYRNLNSYIHIVHKKCGNIEIARARKIWNNTKKLVTCSICH